MSTINMQTMRYINLLSNASHVKTTKCFLYNNTIIFAVPSALISMAIGPNASHVREIQEKLGRKIRIIKEADSISDAEKFIKDIVNPVRFKSIEMNKDIFYITAGNTQNKAMLIGRNRIRESELSKILEDVFGKAAKIV